MGSNPTPPNIFAAAADDGAGGSRDPSVNISVGACFSGSAVSGSDNSTSLTRFVEHVTGSNPTPPNISAAAAENGGDGFRDPSFNSSVSGSFASAVSGSDDSSTMTHFVEHVTDSNPIPPNISAAAAAETCGDDSRDPSFNSSLSVSFASAVSGSDNGSSLTHFVEHVTGSNPTPPNLAADSGGAGVRDPSFNSSSSISFGSSAVPGSDTSSSNGKQNADCERLSSYAAKSDGSDANESSSRSYCASKPHKGSDARWEAIQSVKLRDGELGLDHFRLLKKLGCGDIGSVYLAELRGTACLFAMKVMDRGMLVGRKKLMRAQTEREILGLLDHPFLPTLYSHFETDKFSCLLMEFCSGGDLHTLRQRQTGKHFTEQAARFYASEVLLSLEYLHMMGVIYRDLKPENVLVREDGHIMLSDFDLSLRCIVNPTLIQSNPEPSCRISAYCIEPSCIDPTCKLPVCVEPSCLQPSCFKPRFLTSKTKVKSERLSSTNTDSLPVLMVEPTSARSMSFVGTHEYLSPEIIRGDGHGSAVDWWTFGIFLYELLHGRTPFKGSGNRETLFNVVGKSLKFPEGSNISFAAKDLIRGLLVKDPQKRLGFKRGATEIKQHPFFESVNWALIRSDHPPEIPKPVDFVMPNNNVPKPSSEKAPSDSDRSSGPYLDFEFF